MSGGEGVSETDAANVIALPPVLHLGSVLAGVLMHWLWPLPFLSWGVLRVALGLIVISAAGALVMSAISLPAGRSSPLLPVHASALALGGNRAESSGHPPLPRREGPLSRRQVTAAAVSDAGRRVLGLAEAAE